MNTTMHHRSVRNVRSFIGASVASCRKSASTLQSARQALLDEFRQETRAPYRMLRLALNEAEAIARQTDYPLLVFPVLAREKAEAIAAWRSRQDSILNNPIRVFAA